MYYSVIGDGRADTEERKQQLMQVFFSNEFRHVAHTHSIEDQRNC